LSKPQAVRPQRLDRHIG